MFHWKITNLIGFPNWPEANHLIIYKRAKDLNSWASEKQIQVVVRVGLEPGTAGLPFLHTDHSVALPLLKIRSLENSSLLASRLFAFFLLDFNLTRLLDVNQESQRRNRGVDTPGGAFV